MSLLFTDCLIASGFTRLHKPHCRLFCQVSNSCSCFISASEAAHYCPPEDNATANSTTDITLSISSAQTVVASTFFQLSQAVER